MMKLHTVASSGPGVVDAVPHPAVELAGYGAAVVVGLALLVLARRLARRRRLARHG
jgi:hypothetical protein